jgi:hypothetical protein
MAAVPPITSGMGCVAEVLNVKELKNTCIVMLCVTVPETPRTVTVAGPLAPADGVMLNVPGCPGEMLAGPLTLTPGLFDE